MTTPCFVIDIDALTRNLSILRGVMDRTGAHILLAQKAFSCYATYPLIAQYLSGATASGLYEAKLCREEMPGVENHIFSPAFREQDFDEILDICDHIVFNSPQQLLRFGPRAKAAGLQVGLRINPECSTQEGHAIYDPCAPGSRLGTTLAEFESMLADHSDAIQLLDGLHFHTLCEQDSDDLETTLDAFEAKFGGYLSQLKWVNFGGGHHITRPGYDIPRLERLITRVRDIYKVDVYLEPGEAIALNAGYLYTTVLEVQPTGADGVANVILDTSAACHMPDVIEMPYRPPLEGSLPEEADVPHPNGSSSPGTPRRYRLAGPTCLAGDVIGEYSFDHLLKEGDVLRFNDMAIYSMVKTNTFNGMPLPTIYLQETAPGDEKPSLFLWKKFSYDDFKSRL